MKTVIIGGGIAGMALAILMHRDGREVVVCEREESIPAKGNAFLMHADGLAILEELFGLDYSQALPGKMVDTFKLKRPDNHEIMYLKMKPWQCIKRCDLVSFLYHLLPSDYIRNQCDFSHFIYENEKAVAAVFANGHIEYGDVFIGADGGNSKVRESIFGPTQYTPIEVKEIIGVCENPSLVKKYNRLFTKYLDRNQSLSFGFIPSSETEFVWFMQYNPNDGDAQSLDAADLESFCKNKLSHFPEIVQQIIQSNDFTSSYIWNTRDFDTLPTFHKNNVCLIGDAGHLAVPFTSAGTTNAFVDAKTIFSCMQDCTDTNHDCEFVFTSFYNKRYKVLNEHLLLGRKLKKDFLDFASQHDDAIQLPLISNKEEYARLTPKQTKIHVLYFTDPVCSTCWIIQPQLRKLKMEYGKYLEIEYCMGGLLPEWDGYNRGGIASPEDAANYWDNAAKTFGAPIDGSVWRNDPLQSSYPPSLAFKAAQIQDVDKAIIFLRRINEMVFFENKNIVKKEHLEEAAFDVGLDVARFFRDLNSRAKTLFDEDLSMVKLFDIKVLPTFVFTDSSNNHITLSGFVSYAAFENVIHNLLPNCAKDHINPNPTELFRQFHSLSTQEFAFLTDLPEVSAELVLNNLLKTDKIECFPGKNGSIWKRKTI